MYTDLTVLPADVLHPLGELPLAIRQWQPSE
jgi:hypothetical protein